jgi:broad specificity phosphatase PhoE
MTCSTPLASQDLTTFILLRHAEKADTTRDTDLSDAGYERAERLKEMLQHLDIDAVYSTNYVRTRETVKPLARHLELPVQNYDYINPQSTISNWLRRHDGETVVISGHSNTTPDFTNVLMGREVFEDSFHESDYGNLIFVLIQENGHKEMMRLRY